MPLEDISLHIDALGKDLDEVDELVEDIVHSADSHAEVSVATYRIGGYTKIERVADGSITRSRVGTEVSTECIVYIDGVSQACVEQIRDALAGLFLILNHNFSSDGEGQGIEEDDEHDSDGWLDISDTWVD